MTLKEKQNGENWLRDYVRRLEYEDYVRDIIIAFVVGLIFGATFW